MHIELDVFSGRPNPYWDLDTQEESEFYRMFRNLPESMVDAPSGSELGYRAIIVTGVKKLEGCSEIVVFREHVAAKCDKKIAHLFDKDRELELWLLNTGKKHLDVNIYQLVRSEIEKR